MAELIGPFRNGFRAAVTRSNPQWSGPALGQVGTLRVNTTKPRDKAMAAIRRSIVPTRIR